jgi:hypothetical protein
LAPGELKAIFASGHCFYEAGRWRLCEHDIQSNIQYAITKTEAQTERPAIAAMIVPRAGPRSSFEPLKRLGK